MMRRDDVMSSSNPSNLPARAGRQGGGALTHQGGWSYGESPFQMMRRMQEDMDRVFGSFFTDPFALLAAPMGMGGDSGQMQQMWQPSVDVSEDNSEYRIEADLPGVQPEDIDVRVQQGYLILRSSMNQESGTPPNQPQGQQAGQQQTGQQASPGPQAPESQGERQYYRRERRYGYFQRTFVLPDNVDENAIRCDFNHGVLICHIPKKAQAPQEQDISRRIPINAAGQQQQQTAQVQGAAAAPSTMADKALHEEESHERDVATPSGAAAQKK